MSKFVFLCMLLLLILAVGLTLTVLIIGTCLQAPGDSFPRLVQFLNFPEYRLFVLSGIVISVGGLADSLGKVSSQALLDFLQAAAVENLNGASGDIHISWLGGELLHVLKNFARNDRVIIPALKVFIISVPVD